MVSQSSSSFYMYFVCCLFSRLFFMIYSNTIIYIVEDVSRFVSISPRSEPDRDWIDLGVGLKWKGNIKCIGILLIIFISKIMLHIH